MASTPDRDDALIAAFLRQMHDSPRTPLVVSPRRHATVADLHDQARALAARLATVVPDHGALVAVAVPDGPAFLIALLAARFAGHAVLLLDVDTPLLSRATSAVALGAAAMVTATCPWPGQSADFVVGAVAGSEPRRVGDIAVVKLTSGSTGAPRGVAVSTPAALADEAALADTMGLHGGDRLLATVPLSHSYGFTTLALSAIVRGLALVVPEGPQLLGSLAAASACAATVFPTTPAYLTALLALGHAPVLPASLRLVLSAGARLTPDVASSFRHRHGRPVHTFYGSSECGGICYDQRGDAAERGTVGTPVKDVVIEVAPVEGRAAGEGLIVVRSPALATTYLPEPDPRLGLGRFETADLGRLRDGELELIGRAGQTINVRGRKVEPVEVEQVIRRLDGVDAVVVEGVTSPGGHERVRAIVATRAALSASAIRAWCLQHLSLYKVPRSIVVVDAMRHTARGKIDAAWLANLSDAGES